MNFLNTVFTSLNISVHLSLQTFKGIIEFLSFVNLRKLLFKRLQLKLEIKKMGETLLLLCFYILYFLKDLKI